MVLVSDEKLFSLHLSLKMMSRSSIDKFFQDGKKSVCSGSSDPRNYLSRRSTLQPSRKRKQGGASYALRTAPDKVNYNPVML